MAIDISNFYPGGDTHAVPHADEATSAMEIIDQADSLGLFTWTGTQDDFDAILAVNTADPLVTTDPLYDANFSQTLYYTT